MRGTVFGALYCEGHCIVRGTVLGGTLFGRGTVFCGYCIGRGTVLGGALYWGGGHCIGRGTVLGGELYWGDCIARDTVL